MPKKLVFRDLDNLTNSLPDSIMEPSVSVSEPEPAVLRAGLSIFWTAVVIVLVIAGMMVAFSLYSRVFGSPFVKGAVCPDPPVCLEESAFTTGTAIEMFRCYGSGILDSRIEIGVSKDLEDRNVLLSSVRDRLPVRYFVYDPSGCLDKSNSTRSEWTSFVRKEGLVVDKIRIQGVADALDAILRGAFQCNSNIL